MPTEFDVQRYRARFPALNRRVGDRRAVFLDGPAGSQIPRSVVEAIGRYMLEMNANCGGSFATSRETDRLLEDARRATADLLGSDSPDQVVFGANMTTLTQTLARALGRTWQPGDEIVVTCLEHDANFTPWVQAARDAGAQIRQVAVNKDDCTLDLEDLKAKLSGRTRLVAVGCASNAVGTINPVAEIASLAHAAGARVFLDAVHLAPHAALDVAAWDCDFITCSAYKFFGPHVGILWGKREPMEELPVYKLRPVHNELPHRWETGTQNHEGIAGTMAAIDYLAGLGRDHDAGATKRRPALLSAFRAIEAYERPLALRLLEGLGGIPEIRTHGITDPSRLTERVPTISFTHAELTPAEIAARLGDRGIFVWHGNYYAQPLTETLDLEPHGMVRVGILHYNTAEEIDLLLEALRSL